MGKDVEDSRLGGSGPLDFGKFLQVGGLSNPTVRSGVLGDSPSDQEDPERVTTKGGSLYENNSSKEDRGR